MQGKNILKNEWFLIIGSYLLLALLITWPLITNLQAVVLPEFYPDTSHSDHEEHWGKLASFSYRVSQGAFPFHIDKSDMNHLYLWTGLFFTGVLSMPIPVFFNLYFLLTLFLAGFFTYLFVKDFIHDKKAAWFAGLLYMTAYYIPYAYYWGHSNTTQIQWIPLLFFCLERLIRHQDSKHGVGLGIVLAVQLFSSTQTAVYASVALTLYFLVRIAMDKKIVRATAFWKSAGVAALTAVLITLPYIISKARFAMPIRPMAESMHSYFRLDFLLEIIHPFYHLSFGILQWVLVVFAGYVLWKHFKTYRQYVPFVFLFLFMLLCMIGPVSVFLPYYWLYKLWPFINHLRVPFRMYGFFLFAGVVLATLPLLWFQRQKQLKKHYGFLLIVLVLLVLFQVFTSPWLSGLHLT